jgi:serine/threonine protein kinase/Leucine-rich repeat (LRR) protein
MAEMTSCPSRGELQRMVLGQLPDLIAERIQQHLERCTKCWSALDECVNSDELLDAVRASRGVTCEPTKTLYLPVEHVRGALATWIRSYDRTRSDKSDLPFSMTDITRLLSAPQSADEIGRLGDFHVLRVLGAGGFAIVFEAEDSRLKRHVALKLMHPAIASKQGGADRFLREAQSAAALKHEHVVTIYQVGMHGETPFIALELLHGETLEDCLLRNGRLSIREVVRIGREIATGLAAAHARSLLHRDIKPANIWLEGPDQRSPKQAAPENQLDSALAPPPTEAGQIPIDGDPGGKVKILDFGCAKSWADDSAISEHGLLVGTPAYMAPEQLSGGAVDLRADLFSLGCLLYRMAAGRRPFGGGNLLAVVRSLALEEPAPLAGVNPEVPPSLSDLVGELLSKSPDDRPATAQIVVDRLRAIEIGLPPRGVAHQAVTERLSTDSVENRARGKRLSIAAAVGLALLLVYWAFGAQLIRIATNRGQIVVAVDDPAVTVKVMEHKIVIHDGQGHAEFTLESGDHQLEVTVKEADGETKFKTDKFTLSRGGKKVIEVREELDKAVAARTATRPTQSESASRGAVARPFSGPIVRSDANRVAAKAVLAAGGTVEIRKPGPKAERSVKTITDLPSDSFRITAASLANARPPLGAVFEALTDPGMDSLASLDLSGAAISDTDWMRLKRLPRLRRLVLESVVFRGRELEQLRGFTNLEELGLNRTQTTDAEIAELRALTKLTTLVLDRTLVTDAGLAHLAGLKALKRLSLKSTAVTDAGLAHIEGLPELRSLILEATRVSDAGLKRLQHLPKLESLWLGYGTPVTDAGLAHLAQIKSLRELAFTRTMVTNAGLAQLEELPELNSLWLRETRVTDAGVARLRSLKKLENLSLSRLPVTDSGLASVERLQNLQQLYLDETRVTDAGLAHLKGLTRLYSLDLSETSVTGAGLAELQGLNNLQILSLQRLPRVNDAALPRILRLRGLRSIDIRDTHISARGISILGAALPNLRISWSEPNDTLARAVLGAGGRVDVRLEEDGTERPVKATGELPAEFFQVTRAALAGSGRTLNESLAATSNPRLDALVALDLSGTTIGDPDLERLKSLVALRELNLANTHITDAGLMSLKGLTALRKLSLDGDAIRGSGLAHLQGLTDLAELRLGSPVLTELFLAELAELKHLERLSLAKSSITGEGAKLLTLLPRLKELDLSETRISAARIAKLKASLPQCRITSSAPMKTLATPERP